MTSRTSFGEFHDGVDGVVSSLAEGLHGLGAGALGVLYHHLDVVGVEAFFGDFLGGGGLSHRGLGGGFGLGFLCAFGDDGLFELVDFVLSSLEAVHVGFAKDDVGVLVAGGFPDIGVINADDEGFSLLNGNPVDAGDGFESHFAHGLLELLFASVRLGVKVVVFLVLVLMLMVMLAVLSVNVLGSFLSGFFYLYFLSHPTNLIQYQLIQSPMTSEQQYYEAKVFLGAYRDALSTLDEVASNRATVDKLHCFEKYLKSTISKGEVHLQGNHLREGTHFEESRLRKLGIFSKALFNEKMAAFNTAKTFEDVKKSLESYL